MLKQLLSAVVFLATPLAHAATIHLTPLTPTVAVGDNFAISVHAAGFPTTGGATLGLEFNPSVVHLTGLTLTPGAPFDTLSPTAIDNVAGKVSFITILAPLAGSLPSGDFDVFTMKFTAVGLGTSPVTLIDDGGIKSWTGSDFLPIKEITYQQVLVTVQPIPVPAAVWLFGSGLLGLLSVARRRASRKASA